MTTQQTTKNYEQEELKIIRQGGGDAVYGIGLFGAWAYYLSQASTPQERVQGVLKGFAWPAFLVYELLKYLNK